MIGIMSLASPASAFSGLLLAYTLKIHRAMWQATFPYYSFLVSRLPDANVTHMFPADSLLFCPQTNLNLTILKNSEQ
jgi:hypothetical protein